ncbi:hypothetical protein U0070_003506 [Myodes glareolus]|uniref:Solute carrier family 13 member 2 n=1 Tax=Myodes glareolus TaxID=447135 RepID=A0AAW0JUZ9_MYOGA
MVEAYCAYTIILMALMWCTEALPLAITALFPIVLFPLMGIMDASEVCIEYFNDTNVLFVGGMMVAVSVEHWSLHKRIALRVLLIIGVRPALLLLGFMLVTAFLSMWISNTATTAMMVPIGHAVLEQLQGSQKDVEQGSDNPTFELQEASPQKEATKLDNGQAVSASSEPSTQKTREYSRFHQGLSLCICYSASIGGIATLTGTTPNLVLQGQMNSLFPQNGNVINFASWFGFAFPTMVILLLLAWIWLQVLFLGFNFRKNFGFGEGEEEQKKAAFQVIKNQHTLLGPMNFAEKTVTVLFVFLVVLWFTREPGFFPGWGDTLFANENGQSLASDGTVAIFISLIMFLIPSKVPGLTQDPNKPGKLKAPPAILTWKTVNDKMPWNILILLGGGFALAKGSEQSGLSEWLGEKLTPLEHIPPPATAFILCLLVAIFTECTSNVATTTLFLPILASMVTQSTLPRNGVHDRRGEGHGSPLKVKKPGLPTEPGPGPTVPTVILQAQAICLHPLYVMLPCTLASSLAFMLPVATPPNAIAFSFGGLKVSDMARAGFLLNIIGVLTITLSINSWSFSIFNLDKFPSWAHSNSSQCFPSLPNSTEPGL